MLHCNIYTCILSQMGDSMKQVLKELMEAMILMAAVAASIVLLFETKIPIHRIYFH